MGCIGLLEGEAYAAADDSVIPLIGDRVILAVETAELDALGVEQLYLDILDNAADQLNDGGLSGERLADDHDARTRERLMQLHRLLDQLRTRQ